MWMSLDFWALSSAKIWQKVDHKAMFWTAWIKNLISRNSLNKWLIIASRAIIILLIGNAGAFQVTRETSANKACEYPIWFVFIWAWVHLAFSFWLRFEPFILLPSGILHWYKDALLAHFFLPIFLRKVLHWTTDAHGVVASVLHVWKHALLM